MLARLLTWALMGLFLILILIPTPVLAEQAGPAGDLLKIPIREITIFKDGHAFVLHEGKMPTDQAGDVVLDYLPRPVLGTFWAYSSEKGAPLKAVIASRRDESVMRTATNLIELLRANVGKTVTITDTRNQTFTGTVIAIPQKEPETAFPHTRGQRFPTPPQQAELLLFLTEERIKAINVREVREVVFDGEDAPKFSTKVTRDSMRLQLAWSKKPRDHAQVGMMYLQRGLRWIPSYKVTMDGKGNALVELQATLINELADLEDVAAHLVIGVPRFRFEEIPDPISFQEKLAQLSQHFRRDSRTAYGLSNVMMSQAVMPGRGGRYRQEREEDTIDLGPDVAQGERKEDLFVFEVQHVTLKKAQRMVFPISKFTIPYEDVYTLDIPFAPPREAWDTVRQHLRQRSRDVSSLELQRMFHAARPMHKLRLVNSSEAPLTTAPALIIRDSRLLAQGLMTYTSIGSQVDLPITAAIDIRVKKEETETARLPKAEKWRNDYYTRIDLKGTLTLTNRKDKAVELEVTRYVLGNVGEADNEGEVKMVNFLEGPMFDLPDEVHWQWWRYHDWPWWWSRFNGVGRIAWKVNLAPGESVDLNYTWHYFWR